LEFTKEPHKQKLLYILHLAGYTFHINRMITIPATEQAKQQEWNIILTIPTNNGFPL
jgi:hypothetical protein